MTLSRFRTTLHDLTKWREIVYVIRSSALWDIGKTPPDRVFISSLVLELLRQVLFGIRAGNSNLAKSLSEKSNHAMYQDENPHRCLLSLQN